MFRPGPPGDVVLARDDLKRVQLVQLIGPHGALWQVTEPRPEVSKWLKSPGIEPPATILKLD